MYRANDDFKSQLSHIKDISVRNKEGYKEVEITPEKGRKTIKYEKLKQ